MPSYGDRVARIKHNSPYLGSVEEIFDFITKASLPEVIRSDDLNPRGKSENSDPKSANLTMLQTPDLILESVAVQSVSNCMSSRAGSSIDWSNILCSILTSAGFDAYCVIARVPNRRLASSKFHRVSNLSVVDLLSRLVSFSLQENCTQKRSELTRCGVSSVNEYPIPAFQKVNPNDLKIGEGGSPHREIPHRESSHEAESTDESFSVTGFVLVRDSNNTDGSSESHLCDVSSGLMFPSGPLVSKFFSNSYVLGVYSNSVEFRPVVANRVHLGRLLLGFSEAESNLNDEALFSRVDSHRSAESFGETFIVPELVCSLAEQVPPEGKRIDRFSDGLVELFRAGSRPDGLFVSVSRSEELVLTGEQRSEGTGLTGEAAGLSAEEIELTVGHLADSSSLDSPGGMSVQLFRGRRDGLRLGLRSSDFWANVFDRSADMSTMRVLQWVSSPKEEDSEVKKGDPKISLEKASFQPSALCVSLCAVSSIKFNPNTSVDGLNSISVFGWCMRDERRDEAKDQSSCSKDLTSFSPPTLQVYVVCSSYTRREFHTESLKFVTGVYLFPSERRCSVEQADSSLLIPAGSKLVECEIEFFTPKDAVRKVESKFDASTSKFGENEAVEAVQLSKPFRSLRFRTLQKEVASSFQFVDFDSLISACKNLATRVSSDGCLAEAIDTCLGASSSSIGVPAGAAAPACSARSMPFSSTCVSLKRFSSEDPKAFRPGTSVRAVLELQSKSGSVSVVPEFMYLSVADEDVRCDEKSARPELLTRTVGQAIAEAERKFRLLLSDHSAKVNAEIWRQTTSCVSLSWANGDANTAVKPRQVVSESSGEAELIEEGHSVHERRPAHELGSHGLAFADARLSAKVRAYTCKDPKAELENICPAEQGRRGAEKLSEKASGHTLAQAHIIAQAHTLAQTQMEKVASSDGYMDEVDESDFEIDRLASEYVEDGLAAAAERHRDLFKAPLEDLKSVVQGVLAAVSRHGKELSDLISKRINEVRDESKRKRMLKWQTRSNKTDMGEGSQRPGDGAQRTGDGAQRTGEGAQRAGEGAQRAGEGGQRESNASPSLEGKSPTSGTFSSGVAALGSQDESGKTLSMLESRLASHKLFLVRLYDRTMKLMSKNMILCEAAQKVALGYN